MTQWLSNVKKPMVGEGEITRGRTVLSWVPKIGREARTKQQLQKIGRCGGSDQEFMVRKRTHIAKVRSRAEDNAWSGSPWSGSSEWIDRICILLNHWMSWTIMQGNPMRSTYARSHVCHFYETISITTFTSKWPHWARSSEWLESNICFVSLSYNLQYVRQPEPHGPAH
jgi:hypothetical protein